MCLIWRCMFSDRSFRCDFDCLAQAVIRLVVDMDGVLIVYDGEPIGALGIGGGVDASGNGDVG